jgi:hypothetical protein
VDPVSRSQRNDGFGAVSGPSQGEPWRSGIRPNRSFRRRDLLCPLHVDFVEEPSVLAPALGICGDVSEADSWLFASCGEDGRRERNELRQLSEVLGGGGQQELIFGSTRPTQAQSIQPEDALQMSEEHLDLLSFAT